VSLAAAGPANAQTVGRVLHDPFFANGGTATPEQLAALGRTDDPHDALMGALRDLAAAPDAGVAAAEREKALAILEGRPVEGAYAFEGLPLLNWNAPTKVKTVPAGGSVTIRQVRFDGHVLTDTARLAFDDPALPYTIVYEIAALGARKDGHLAPTPLAAGGTGRHARIDPLNLDVLPTGTTATSRFTPNGAPEETRLAVQRRSVPMPAPGSTSLVLDPNRPGDGPALSTRAADSTERAATIAGAFGFSGGPAAVEPTAEQRTAAIGKLSDSAPEKQLWDDLRAADPTVAATTPPDPAAEAAALAAAKAVGRDDQVLVGVMRSRSSLPVASDASPTADVTVALLNNEAYVSREELRKGPGARVTVAVVNRDQFPRTITTRQLSGRAKAFGADDWGSFAWSEPTGGQVTIPAGATGTLDVPVADSAFALVVGDEVRGDESSAVVHLRRGALRESIRVGQPGTLPLHMAFDSDGRAWTTLAGVDKLVRLTPKAGEPLSAATAVEVLLPGGVYDPTTAAEPRWGPADVKVDGSGIVWATLGIGSAVARINPALVRDGTSAGVTIYELEPCTEAVCRPPPPPAPPGPLSREPVQMRVFQDGPGNTVVVFVEALGDRIGVLRVGPDGEKKNEMHVPCGCTTPAGIDLDPDGSVWFSEAVDNRIGHLIFDRSRPYSEATVTLRHHRIPSGNDICDFDPELLFGVLVCTSAPHSVELDADGMVWFTETATGKIGRLDPALATNGTSAGMREFDLPPNDFGRVPDPADLAIDRAGTIFWADEYGDAIGEMTNAGTPKPPFRPAERQSLTDSPAITPDGDVWFIESAAEIVSRLRGVSAGLRRHGAAPEIVADTATSRLRGSGLLDVTSVDWSVRRGSSVVASDTRVPVINGAFSVPVTAPMQAGDLVRVTPAGPGAFEALVFRLVALTAEISGQAVSGTAKQDGTALADSVRIQSATGTVHADINVETGAFSASGVGDGATVAWAQGTTAGRFVTLAPVTGAAKPPPPADPPPADPPPADPPPATEPQINPPANTSPPAGGAGGDGGAALAPNPIPSDSAGTKEDPIAAATCTRTTWLDRDAIPLLGMTQAGLRTCLGKPRSSRKISSQLVLRWPGLVETTLRSGRVVSFRLLGGLTSRPAGATLGRPLAAWRRVVPGLRRRDARRWAATLKLPGAGSARLELLLGTKTTTVVGVSVRRVRTGA